ncbi:12508_t:CDS:2 [Ambispora leptoticha]|uniref:12508_t:CDS:1 n=1 Tax=Ambispora leptoticha TaxID=144679 RepID=A0A9N9FRB2_9GLOM|nr:12508_t:CDS:2 [Ambispora leptoticha]
MVSNSYNKKKIDKEKGKQVLRDEDEDSEDPLSFPASHIQREEQHNSRQLKQFAVDDDTSDDPLTQCFVTTTTKSYPSKPNINKKRLRSLRRQKIQRFLESTSNYSLQPKVCSISQTTIQQRWKPLDTLSKRQLVRALRNIASSVTFNIRNASKRAEVQRDLDALISSINKRLETVSLPKPVKNMAFDSKKFTSQNVKRYGKYSCVRIRDDKANGNTARSRKTATEERDALERFREMKISQDSQSSRRSESKLYPLLQAKLEDPIDIDDELIKNNITAPLTKEEERVWDPAKDQTIIDLKNSLLPHLRSINSSTQSLDDVVYRIGDAERKLWRLLRVAGLDEQISQIQ